MTFPQSANAKRLLFSALLVAALGIALVQALRLRWVCDDAFISFRYARNLLDGNGLVWNAGERVEGYTNFLWTIWCALGMALGVSPESWSMAWGIAFYLGCVGLLGYHSVLLRRASGNTLFPLPVAALLAALHADWNVYATSGLETSAFTFLALAGTILIERSLVTGRWRSARTGLVFALAALTRPDGVLFAMAGGAAIALFARPRLRHAIRFAAAFAIPCAAYGSWRLAYYGDLFPNTYYAKSAALAWWSQGWHYLVLYFERYGILLAGPLLALVAALRPARAAGVGAGGSPVRRFLAIEAAFALLYGAYVTRVGGDFMYARLLIPATPFLMLLAESSLAALFPAARLRFALAGLALLAALVLPPAPLEGGEERHGIVNERGVYGADLVDGSEDTVAATLRRFLNGKPVRVAFLGGQAHLMYRAEIPVAIESAAGLTDRAVAHQTLAKRGRVGHEKRADLDYLIGTRKTHFVFHGSAPKVLGIGERIPLIPIDLGGARGWVLHWDPALMEELRAAGGVFPDFPATIDSLIVRLDDMTDADAAKAYARLKLFYFDSAGDPARESVFRSRLAGVP